MKEGKDHKKTYNIAIAVDCSDLDVAIEKANRLVELLHEASTVIDSLAVRLAQNPN